MRRTLPIFLILLISFLRLTAQPCYNFHNVCMENLPKDKDKTFKFNSQSKSGLFEKGQTSKLKLVVYRGVDYKFTFCTEASTEGEIGIKLMDKDTIVLFDNANEDMTQAFEYTSNATKSLTLVVTMPGEPPTKDEKNLPGSKACVGVIIKHRMSAKTGF